MTRFLGQVNVGDLVQQRRHVRRATVLKCLLEVQWLLTAQHADEMDDVGITADEAQDRSDHPGAAPHSGYILAGAIHEFLEHLDVIAFVDQFVEQILEDRRTVRQFSRVMYDSADQHHLELERDLQCIRGDPTAHVDSALQRLLGVPFGRRQRGALRIQLPPWVVVCQRVLWCVPVDVDVGVEASSDRRTREGLHPVEIEVLCFGAVRVADRCHVPIR